MQPWQEPQLDEIREEYFNRAQEIRSWRDAHPETQLPRQILGHDDRISIIYTDYLIQLI